MKFVSLILMMTIFISVQANIDAEEVDVTKDLRIQQLIPSKENYFSLGIEPSIPKDFIAMGSNGGKDYSFDVCWGPEKILKEFFKDPKSLSQPIIQCFLSMNICQHFSHGFDKMQVIREFAQENVSVNFGNWGNYPYFTVARKLKGKSLHMAWVGLNAESRAVLVFNLLSPERDGSPIPEGIALWNTFINETKQLPEPFFYKVLGQEMHPGYTIVDIDGHKTKVIAERRKRDQKLQYAVIPLDYGLDFEFQNVEMAAKGGKWHRGDPLLKIKGVFNESSERNITTFYTASVFIKEVDKFTGFPNKQKGIYIGQMEAASKEKM